MNDICLRGKCLDTHWERYRAFYQQYKEDQNREKWAHDNLLKQLQEQPIYCTKYNYTLDKTIMNHYQFECRLEISKDGKELILNNHKMDTRPQYIYELTPDECRQMRRELNEEKKTGIKYQDPREIVNEQFKWNQSSSTCKLEDI